MLKLIAALCMILGGAGIGYAGSRELTEREKNLEILLQILFLLKGEIRCGNSSLSEAFGEIAGKIEGSFSKILLDAAQEMRGSGGSNLTEATNALMVLGYTRAEAVYGLKGASPDADIETLIRCALAKLMK